MDGLLVVNKPQGMTSHDVVDFIRKSFALKKVGHAGTLDPMAVGVLVILIGRYTKASGRFISDDKEYEGTLVLGATSDTGDAWGAVSYCGDTARLTEEEIKKAFKNFLGEIEQLPPMYSAVKFKGRKLYELARKGLSVNVNPRKISIKKIEVLSISLPEVSFKVTCSKGTYVRQLCADIGKALGCGAYLAKLNRTRSGRFTVEEAVTMDEIRNFKREDLEKRLYRI